MRTSFHLLFFLGATVAWPLAAQEQARPLRKLVETVERQTGLRVVGDPAVLDSTLVTPSAGGTDPIQALSEALRPAKLYVVRYEGDLIISGNPELTTTLPDDYFNAVESPVGQEDMASGLTLPGERKASSENKVYEVGSPTAGSEKWLTLSGVVTNFKTGEPLSGVAIQLGDGQGGTTTDKLGH